VAVFLLVVSATAAALNTQWAFSSTAPYFTEEDWVSEERTLMEALNDNPDGKASGWQGAESGIEGTATPLESYKNKQGQSCRLLELTSKRMEQVDRAAGHFCRDADDKWVFVGMAQLKDPSESQK
jgi:surface antigen